MTIWWKSKKEGIRWRQSPVPLLPWEGKGFFRPGDNGKLSRWCVYNFHTTHKVCLHQLLDIWQRLILPQQKELSWVNEKEEYFEMEIRYYSRKWTFAKKERKPLTVFHYNFEFYPLSFSSETENWTFIFGSSRNRRYFSLTHEKNPNAQCQSLLHI